jgi:hypothetical protein
LSKLEKSGLTLSKIESAGLLSTAERLGLLAVAEDILTSNPATLASNSLPFIVLAVLSASLIPHDNGLETTLSYGLALIFGGVATVRIQNPTALMDLPVMWFVCCAGFCGCWFCGFCTPRGLNPFYTILNDDFAYVDDIIVHGSIPFVRCCCDGSGPNCCS